MSKFNIQLFFLQQTVTCYCSIHRQIHFHFLLNYIKSKHQSDEIQVNTKIR